MRRREHCEADSPAMSASSWLVSRPSSCNARRILRSKASRETMHETSVMCTKCANDSETATHLHAHCAAGERIFFQHKREIRMGPFPHDAPPATISADNPMGTDGFEFVEYAHPDAAALHALFQLMGFAAVARHRTRKITVYRQGDVNYLVNEEAASHGFNFVTAHGPCAPSMAFRVVDAKRAYDRAIALGAEPADVPAGQKVLDVPAIKGIGGSLLYLVDRYGAKGSAYDAEYEWLGARDPKPAGAG